MCQCVYMRVYSNATSETYPLSRKPAFIGINKANVSEKGRIFVKADIYIPGIHLSILI